MSTPEENIGFIKALVEERYIRGLSGEDDLPITFTVHEEDLRSGLSGDYFIDQSRSSSPSLTYHEFMKWRKAVIITSYVSLIVQLALSILSIVEGLKVDSAGTLGFGIEMAMDIGTTVVVLWHYSSTNEVHASKAKEKIAVTVLSVMMCLFSLGVIVKTTYNLYTEKIPFNEIKLMLICSGAAFLFSFLAWTKLYLSRKLASNSVLIDAISTFGCLSMALALMSSLIVYHYTTLWFLDGIIAIIISLVMCAYGSRTLFKMYRCKKPSFD